ncbi:Ig-like domain-containing protein [Actinoplanes campanulatus]|uniref:Ig-like domain-containing protein n=1 Tax=Actinoplanes campanulatus TaxID=113559 RepID=UPI001952B30E|nr:Ig-like domain-containing protein [Actinoplanes capillaceus]
MLHRSVFRWALGGLTATALSVTGLSVPAYAADTPALIIGGPQQLTAALGQEFEVTLSATNSGDTAVDGAAITFDTVWAFEDREQFSNCEYDGGLVRACVFDQTLEPGKSYRVVVPFRVREDTYAPSMRDSFYLWQPASEHVSAGTPGTGPVLRLQEGDRIGEVTEDTWQRFTLNVTGNQGTDLVAVGDTAAGWVGDVVEAEVGVRNNGPATLDFSRSGLGVGWVVATAPAGTSIVGAPDCFKVTSTQAMCETDYRFKVGEVKTWKLALRIDRSVPGAAGSVEVNPDCTCERFFGDADKSNNRASLTVEASVDETDPVIEDAGLVANQSSPAVVFFQPRVTDNVKVTKVEVTGVPAATSSTCMPKPSSDLWQCKAVQQVAYNAETDNVLTIKAYDAAGNVSEQVSVPVHVDNKFPRHTVSPAPKSSLRSGPVTVELIDVPADVKEVKVLDSRTDALVTTLTAAPWTYTWNAANDATPPAFQAVDRVGNLWHVSTDYIVDDESPVIDHVDTVSQYLPNRVDTGTGWAGSKANLEYTATDESPIARTEWWVDGVLASTTPLFSWDARTITAPTARVELRVWDAAGNTASKSFTVNIDKTVSATVVAPAQNTLIRSTSFVTSVTVNDPHGKAYSTILSPVHVPGSRSWAKVTSGKDGTKTIIWEVADRLGNVAQFRRTVIVDNTAPAASLRSAPKNNAKLTKTFGVTVNASDKNGIGRVELLVNGRKVATDYRAGWAFKINPKRYGKKFTVQLRVYDRAGNSKLTAKRTYRR